MLCVGVLITLSGSIEQDSLYSIREHISCRLNVLCSTTHLPLHSPNLISGCFFRSSCRDIPQNARFVLTPPPGGGGALITFLTPVLAHSVFAPSNEYSSSADSCCHTPTDLPQFSANFTSRKITRLPRSPPLLF